MFTAPMVRCKQILFKSTELNQARLTQGRRGNQRGREGMEPGGKGGAGPAVPGWQEAGP